MQLPSSNIDHCQCWETTNNKSYLICQLSTTREDVMKASAKSFHTPDLCYHLPRHHCVEANVCRSAKSCLWRPAMPDTFSIVLSGRFFSAGSKGEWPFGSAIPDRRMRVSNGVARRDGSTYHRRSECCAARFPRGVG